MSDPARIWLTRPAADSAKLAARLSNFPTLIAPVTTIEHAALSVPEKPDVLLITSRHAAAFLAQMPPDWRELAVYCVGIATATAVRAQGFTNTHTAGGDVMSLLVQLKKLPAGTRLLYLAGTDRRVDVSALLSAHSIQVQVLEVYRAAALSSLGQPAAKALAAGGICGVVFFSPRTAKIACHLMMQAGLADEAKRINAYCLSLAVAHAAGALPWRGVHACHVPTANAMVELIASQASAAMV
ncbi:MAG: uroporphyrinogen-III synthase [Rickettsiales bacterium]